MSRIFCVGVMLSLVRLIVLCYFGKFLVLRRFNFQELGSVSVFYNPKTAVRFGLNKEVNDSTLPTTADINDRSIVHDAGGGL